MTNTPDQRIDDLLDSTFAYNVDWTEYRDTSGGKGHDLSTYVVKIKDGTKASLKAKLKAMFEAVMSEVVGLNDNQAYFDPITKEWTTDMYSIQRNQLRDQQRQRIPQVLDKYFKGGK